MTILGQLVTKANLILPSVDKKVALDSLISIFKEIKCKDLKIDKPLTLSKPIGNGKKVFYYPLVENEKFTLAIFAFPPNTSIPTHDHPKMTVLSKVLYGSISCDSFDWIDESSNDKKQGKAIYTGTNILNCDEKVKITFPNENNIHRFQSHDQHCAVLDLLYPPYNANLYRDCTYYKPTSINGSIVDLMPYYPDFDCEGDSSNKQLNDLHKELSNLK
ncbi:hypothetical protein RB653_010460 [Dictyostelium firmibasis]|uniref:Cysteine dioxygenase n=1 Tax=Dictyostelium firmibasis TaxID=79012 RepID=A0AAN7TLL1_9MYCE